MSSINWIETMAMFVAVVEHGSYTRAAEVLHVYRPALSKSISSLEKELGTQLLRRTTRRVAVTPDGEQFYARCVKILADVAETLNLFSPERPPRGKLKVDMQTVLGHEIILPRLPEFMARYPDLEITITASDKLSDLVAAGIDCAIRLGDWDDSSLIAKRIGEVELVTCASPAYVERFGAPTRLDELVHHRAVNFWVEQRHQIMPWRFCVDGGTVDMKVDSAIVVDNAEVLLSCTLAGIGMAQALRPALQPYIDCGRLLEVLPDVPAQPKQVSVLFPDRLNLSANVRVFTAWIAGLFRAPHDELLPVR